jgi:hypothetical protein
MHLGGQGSELLADPIADARVGFEIFHLLRGNRNAVHLPASSLDGEHPEVAVETIPLAASGDIKCHA